MAKIPTTKMIHEAINHFGPEVNEGGGQRINYLRALRHIAAVVTDHPDADLITEQADKWVLQPYPPSDGDQDVD